MRHPQWAITTKQITTSTKDARTAGKMMPPRLTGFDKVRDLTATAFYTTRVGLDDLGYVGNVPLASWDPPPEAALRHAGLNPGD